MFKVISHLVLSIVIEYLWIVYIDIYYNETYVKLIANIAINYTSPCILDYRWNIDSILWNPIQYFIWSFNAPIIDITRKSLVF